MYMFLFHLYECYTIAAYEYHIHWIPYEQKRYSAYTSHVHSSVSLFIRSYPFIRSFTSYVIPCKDFFQLCYNMRAYHTPVLHFFLSFLLMCSSCSISIAANVCVCARTYLCFYDDALSRSMMNRRLCTVGITVVAVAVLLVAVDVFIFMSPYSRMKSAIPMVVICMTLTHTHTQANVIDMFCTQDFVAVCLIGWHFF